ncbi:YdeI family protein [Jeotgalibacillus sp. ET6]|uniref:YdeI/OmpD-associated family protein n=1 Tax=Jeotgalibacillus sp. ET6 TaxID=3037260 RepID=UPI0024182398|nr:YdeI family protein [Jeotgalibacillus sp. ET6]MDG5472346.1 YdeI family protein [Jeotgalibacillus sp. ET6]
MTKSIASRKVDGFLKKEKKWQAEFQKLRELMLECGLTEDFKWMHPCYTVDGKNVVIIHGFKDYCAIMFQKGALMKDPDHLLIQQTKNSQAARQIRFSQAEEITALGETIKMYIQNAIEIEKAGLEIDFKDTSEYTVPEELQHKFEEMPELKTAFEALTPGRQRGYLLYFSEVKQAKTRESRIEKAMEKIMDGKGLRD